jgi:putative FmdB family regulatory protein
MAVPQPRTNQMPIQVAPNLPLCRYNRYSSHSLLESVKTLPLYAYRCTQCGYLFEKIQKFSANPEIECPKCHGVLERPITAPALSFKGAGWYVNDYAAKSSAPTSDSSTESKKDTPSSDSKADSKSEIKSVSASADTTSSTPAAAAPAAAPATSPSTSSGSST